MTRPDKIMVEFSPQDRHVLGRIAKALEKQPVNVERVDRALESYLQEGQQPRYFVGEREFPFESGDVLVLGPELFIDSAERVLSYKGQEYYKPCGEFVRNLDSGGQSYCVKIVNHARPNEHEDSHGFISTGFADNTTEETPS